MAGNRGGKKRGLRFHPAARSLGMVADLSAGMKLKARVRIPLTLPPPTRLVRLAITGFLAPNGCARENGSLPQREPSLPNDEVLNDPGLERTKPDYSKNPEISPAQNSWR
jgi:hypothetical protein